MTEQIELVARELQDRSGWVIDALWTDQQFEQLLGVFTSIKAANDWIDVNSEMWRTWRGERQMT